MNPLHCNAFLLSLFSSLPEKMTPSITLPELILELYDVGGLKFGSFTVRTGEVTPVYIDMRVIWSYPKLVVRMHKYLNNFYLKSLYYRPCRQ